MLDRAATNQEREMDGLLSTMTNLLGPFMVVFMGAIVMFTAGFSASGPNDYPSVRYTGRAAGTRWAR